MPENTNNKLSPSNAQKTGRIVSNTIILFLRMFALTVVNLYTVRIILQGLGEEDYGIFVSVAGVVTTMTCFSGVLALSIQRFLSFAIGRKDEKELKNVFSSSMYISVCLSLIIIIAFETIGYWFLNTQLTIPADRMWAAQVTYHVSLAAYVLSILQIPYNAAIIAHEEMGFYALISTVECFFKLFVAVFIGYILIDNLVYYSSGLLVAAVIIFLCYYFTGRIRYEECKLQKVYDKGLIRRLISFSGWTFYGSLSHMGMIQGSTILLNIFFGPLANVAFGIAIQIDNAFTALGNSMIMALRPPMIKAYAEKNYTYLNQMFSFGNKFILYVLLVVSFPLISEMKTILHLWLGTENPGTILFAQLMIVYVVVLALQGPITTIMQASGKIRQYHLPVETVTIMCIPVTWILFKAGLPSYMVFVAMIGLCVMAHIVRLVCLYRYYPYFELRKYITSFLIPAVIITLTVSGMTFSCSLITDSQIISTVCHIIIIPLILVLMTYYAGLDRNERTLLRKMIKTYLHKTK